MSADALVTLGAMASAGMVLTPKPEYFVSSIRRVNKYVVNIYRLSPWKKNNFYITYIWDII